MPNPLIPPAGLSPATLTAGVELVGPSKPPAILADDVDPMTGEYRSILRGVHPVDGMVVVALRTQRGTGAAVPDVGSDLAALDKVDDTLPQRIKFEIQAALASLVKQRLIRIDAIVTAADGDAASAYCEYTNLQTQKAQRVPV
ncbi:MAG TPA: hypothetical protein VGM56_23700 [Byssovorax sp.]|jgi:hypothetical protein